MVDQIFRYVLWERIPDYLLLGWMVIADLGPVHGEWSVLMEFRCACSERVRERVANVHATRCERLLSGAAS